MAISIILGHPTPGSFNSAIAQTAARTLRERRYAVNLHDLYAEKFDPLLPTEELAKGMPADEVIRRHCREIVEAEGIIIVHPNWWGQPPAILKGWVDRVLRMGVAYEFRANEKGEGEPVGLLKARAAVVFTTSNTPKDVERAMFGDPLENLWSRCILQFCGVSRVRRINYDVIITSTPEQRQAWLEDVKSTIGSIFPGTAR